MAADQPLARSSITESPWYWVYVFSTAALIALWLMGPRFATRQSQIERTAQGRQRAIQNLSGHEPVTPMSDAEHTQIGLRPLYYTFAAVLAFVFVNLARRMRKRYRSSDTPQAQGISCP